MTKAMRLLAAVACVVLVTAGLAGSAYGFFPKGGFNLNQQIRYATWPFRDFDTNENGTIEGGEGLEFRIETGPRGFSSAEVDLVKAGFAVWQDVPTSYAAFRFVGNIEDPLLPGMLNMDYLPMVFMQVEEVAADDGYSQPDADEYLTSGLSWAIPAITYLTYTIDTAVIDVAERQVIVPAGTILDCDIVVNASVHRAGIVTGTSFGTLDLQATVAHHVGQLLGLAYTPLNNLDPYNEVTMEGADIGLPVEPAVLQITGTDGLRGIRGATPTMFPVYFLTEMPEGDFVGGWRDLAPDDISGISWLYPREDGLQNFFTVQQEARTHTRDTSGVPSAPVSGAHIVAWASLGTGDTGERVPLFSTMTGLYQKSSNTQLQGRFSLMGLWKQMELPGGLDVMYEPSYVFTMNQLNGAGYERQAPPEVTPDYFDSLQGPIPVSYSLYTRDPGSFSTNYPSEVYNEYGNVYGIDNYVTGTPLAWSFTKNTVVSRESDKILSEMLPTTRPMFGDQDVVCPMNIIENIGEGTTDTETVLDGAEGILEGITGEGDLGGLTGLLGTLGKDDGNSGGWGGGSGARAVFARVNYRLRAFRDDVLLKSAAGTALVDLYYRIAPYLAGQLLRHGTVLRLVRGIILAGTSIWESGIMTFGLLTVAGLLIWRLRPRTRGLQAAAAGMLVFIVVVSAAFAGQMPIPTEDLVAEASYIFTGEVISADGRVAGDNRIYTDVVIKVRNVVKGQLNQNSNLTFSVVGGKYGNIVTSATSIPGFAKGDQALLYLKDTDKFGLIPFGGYRSKVPIVLDPETNEEMLVSDGALVEGEAEEGEGADTEGESTKSRMPSTDEDNVASSSPAPPAETPSGLVPLDEYLYYLRGLVRSLR